MTVLILIWHVFAGGKNGRSLKRQFCNGWDYGALQHISYSIVWINASAATLTRCYEMRPPIWSTIWIFVNELCTMENTNNRNRSTGSIAVLQSMTHIDQRILMLWTQTYLHSNPKFAKSLSSIAMRTFLVSAMVGCQNEPVFFARVFSLLASTFAKLCTPHGACDTSTLPVHLFYLFPGKRLSVWLARAVSLSLSLSLSLFSLSPPTHRPTPPSDPKITSNKK